MYLCDGIGSAFNDFLGDVRVDTYLPTSDGTDQSFAYSAGASAYPLLDEVPQSDADYVIGGTIGDRFSTKINATDDGRTIIGAMIHAFVSNPDAGTRGIKLFAKHGVSEAQSAEFGVTSSGRRVWQCIETDPDSSGALTYSDINAIEYGVEITS